SLRTQQRARSANPSRPAFRPLTPAGCQGCTSRCELVHGPNNQCSTSELPPQAVLFATQSPEMWLWTRRPGGRLRQVLLRKEVIQPPLPVRLPCYDFVPIAGPTFDGSLPYGLGHRLRVLLTFVT